MIWHFQPTDWWFKSNCDITWRRSMVNHDPELKTYAYELQNGCWRLIAQEYQTYNLCIRIKDKLIRDFCRLQVASTWLFCWSEDIHGVDQHGIKSWELTINNQQLGPLGLMNHVFIWFISYSWGAYHWGWLNPHLHARQVRPPPGRAVSASPQHCGPCQMTWSGLRPARGPGAKGENMLKHRTIDETWPFLVQHIQNIDHYCMTDAAVGFATHMIHLPIFKDDNDQRSLDIRYWDHLASLHLSVSCCMFLQDFRFAV